tara:strand:+ start:195 stop:341 length:147 start_codon:yes stop_codon:yes gene_type:complete
MPTTTMPLAGFDIMDRATDLGDPKVEPINLGLLGGVRKLGLSFTKANI